jgi:hypothetical protein
MASSGIDPAIFEHLQAKIDDEGRIRDVLVIVPLYPHLAEQSQELKDIIQQLEKQGVPAIPSASRTSRI